MSHSIDSPVLIIGGGPTGFLLSLLLSRQAIPSIILEKRNQPMEHSRSIGIHPPSLEILQELNIAPQFLTAGVKVKRGLAYLDREPAGTLSFESCPLPFNFVLTLPQNRTETLLEEEVRRSQYIILHRNITVEKISIGNTHVEVEGMNRSSDSKVRFKGNYLVACDGKNSVIRSRLNIPFEGKAYPDTYVMADVADDTDWDSDAAVILHQEGVIESFPLPGNMRRWVAKTRELIDQPDPETVRELVAKRFGHRPSMERVKMVSSFGVQRYLAKSFRFGNVLLAGDAAHVLSPIGGQGMNLGWLDAYDAAKALGDAVLNRSFSRLNHYHSLRKREARLCIRRAALNMWLGRRRKGPTAIIRKLLIRGLMKPTVARQMARKFTMRDRGNKIF